MYVMVGKGMVVLKDHIGAKAQGKVKDMGKDASIEVYLMYAWPVWMLLLMAIRSRTSQPGMQNCCGFEGATYEAIP